MSRHHVFKLAASIGRESAVRELRWMKQALKHGHNDKDLAAMVDRRVRGEPLQYILGTQPFGPLDILTRPPVLIPRPETEFWTIQLANLLSPTADRPINLLDLCTGTGCIPLLLCHLWPLGSTCAHAVDISPHAIQLAEDNAVRCAVAGPSSEPTKSAINFILADILDPSFTAVLPRPFDVVTSNPPYISQRDYDMLPASVKDYEDPTALLADLPGADVHDGLSFYRSIAHVVAQEGMLSPQGLVALEVGENQAASVRDIILAQGRMSTAEIWKDPWGKDRVVVARV